MIFALIPHAAFLDAWTAAFWRASWQGAIAIGLAWSACRYIPRLSPNVRCWLWRLALLKMLLAIVPWHTLDLPLLPKSLAFSQAAVANARPESQGFGTIRAAENDLSTASSPSNREVGKATAAGESESPGNASRRDSASPAAAGIMWRYLPAIQALLFCLWTIVLAIFVVMLGWRVRAARRWRREWRLIKDRDLLTLGERLSTKMGLFQPPVLFEAESCLSPVVFGAMRTAIVLPAQLVAGSDLNRLQMILTHEMAHIRRGDLLGNWYSTLISGLFFFHPGVWLALRESRLAQEVACDELAVHQPEVSVADYGRLLVELATRCPPNATPLVSVGVVESFHIFLKRRLNAMKEFRTRSWGIFAMSWFLAGIAALGLLPWRVIAQSESAEDEPAVQADQPAAPQDRDAAGVIGAENNVQVETKSGPFTLTADRVRRYIGNRTPIFAPNGFPISSGAKLTPKTESFQGTESKQIPGMGEGVVTHGGSATTMGGGGGSGGAFIPPNLIIDLGLKTAKLKGKQQWLCNLVGKVQAADDQGRALEGPDSPPFMKWMIPGVDYRQEAGRTAVHLYLPPESRDAKYIQSLDGELLVAEGILDRMTFSDGDLSKPTTKRGEGVSVRLDKISQTPKGVELELARAPRKRSRSTEAGIQNTH